MRRPPYLTAPEAAELLRCSLRSLHGLTAAGRVPHRRLLGQRRLLFLEDELAAWVDGAELEVFERDGGRVVRPRVDAEKTP
jgi:excisionase family DNA binding protein